MKMLDQMIKNEESLQLTGEDGQRVDPYKNENADFQGDRNGATNGSSLNRLEINEARNSLAPGALASTETLIIGKYHSNSLCSYLNLRSICAEFEFRIDY